LWQPPPPPLSNNEADFSLSAAMSFFMVDISILKACNISTTPVMVGSDMVGKGGGLMRWKIVVMVVG
jgi:hypothetical protein